MEENNHPTSVDALGVITLPHGVDIVAIFGDGVREVVHEEIKDPVLQQPLHPCIKTIPLLRIQK